MLIDYQWTSKSRPMWFHGRYLGQAGDGIHVEARCVVFVQYQDTQVGAGVNLTFDVEDGPKGTLDITLGCVPPLVRPLLVATLREGPLTPLPAGIRIGHRYPFDGIELAGCVLAASVEDDGPVMLRLANVDRDDIEAFLTAQRAERNAVT